MVRLVKYNRCISYFIYKSSVNVYQLADVTFDYFNCLHICMKLGYPTGQSHVATLFMQNHYNSHLANSQEKFC